MLNRSHLLRLKAWKFQWTGKNRYNSCSIGVELDHIQKTFSLSIWHYHAIHSIVWGHFITVRPYEITFEKKMCFILSTILFVNVSQEWMPMQWIIICTYAFSIGPNGALYVIIICSSFEYHNRTMYSKLKLKSFHSHSFNVFLFRFLPTTFACFYDMYSICIFNKDVQWYGWHTVRLLLIVQEVLLIFSTLFDIANTIKSRTLATSSL